MVMTYEIPIDCLKHVLNHLEAEDVARCAQVSRKWRDVCYVETVWKRLCQQRWRYWNVVPKSGWRQIFLARIATDNWAMGTLDKLVVGGAHFLTHMHKLRQLGDNCRDVLLWVMMSPKETSLSHSYYAKRALQCSRRYDVVQQWRAWRNGLINLSTLSGFALLAIFFNERVDIEDVELEVDQMALEFQRLTQGLPPENNIVRFRRLLNFFSQIYPSSGSYYDVESRLMYLLNPMRQTKDAKAAVLAVVFEALAQKVGFVNLEIVADRARDSYRRYHFVRLVDLLPAERTAELYFVDFKHHSAAGVMNMEEFDRHAAQFYGALANDYDPIPQRELIELFITDYTENIDRLLGHSRELIYGAALQRHFLIIPDPVKGGLQDLAALLERWWEYITIKYKYPEDYELGQDALRDVGQYLTDATETEMDMWHELFATIEADTELLEANDKIEWDYSGKVVRSNKESDPKFFIGDVVYFGKFDCLGVVCRWDKAYDIESAESIGKFAYSDHDCRKNQPYYEVLTRRSTLLYCAEEKLKLEPRASDRLSRMVPPNQYGDYCGDESDWEFARALGPITTELVGAYFKQWDPVNGRYIMNETTSKWFPDG